MKLDEERLYGKQIASRWKNIERSARYILQKQGQEGAIIEKLLEETRRLREANELRISGEERLLQKMDARQKVLWEWIQNQQNMLK